MDKSKVMSLGGETVIFSQGAIKKNLLRHYNNRARLCEKGHKSICEKVSTLVKLCNPFSLSPSGLWSRYTVMAVYRDDPGRSRFLAISQQSCRSLLSPYTSAMGSMTRILPNREKRVFFLFNCFMCNIVK